MLFVDFPQAVISQLPPEFQAEASATRWNNPTAASIPFERHSIIFFNASYSDQASTSLHITDRPRLAEVLSRRGLVVYFMSERCESFHLTNLLGLLSWLQLSVPLLPPQQVHPVQTAPYLQLFSRYGHQIQEARGVAAPTYVALSVVVEFYRRQGLAALAFFFQALSHYPVAVSWMQAGGTVMILPSFQPTILPEIITFIKEEVLPSQFPHLIQTESDAWLQDPRYLMEPVRALTEQRVQIASEYENRLVQVDEQIRRARETQQEPFDRLLTATGDTLKQAVMEALQYLGMQAIDVDSYWRERAPDRQREEDLWIAEQQFDPQLDGFRLVEVTSDGRGGASEDDCGRIIRYLLRRRREFSNDGITGLLVINHQYRTPAHVRRPPFTATQIADAERDGYGLSSTYGLFKAIKAEKAGRISRQQIAQRLLTDSGYLEFPEI